MVQAKEPRDRSSRGVKLDEDLSDSVERHKGASDDAFFGESAESTFN